jgi:hypothetical protein
VRLPAQPHSFDNAEVYAKGKAEEIMGQAIKVSCSSFLLYTAHILGCMNKEVAVHFELQPSNRTSLQAQNKMAALAPHNMCISLYRSGVIQDPEWCQYLRSLCLHGMVCVLILVARVRSLLLPANTHHVAYGSARTDIIVS